MPSEEITMPEPLDDNIRENAQGPKRASGDAGSVEQHDLTDQISFAHPLVDGARTLHGAASSGEPSWPWLCPAAPGDCAAATTRR
jgi:hypothetical protein